MEESTNQKAVSYEEKREAKQKERLARERQEKQKKLVRRIVGWVVVAIVIVGIGFWVANQGPKGEDYSKAFPIQGRDHIEEGSTHPAYNSNPPSSGWHYANPARDGFYETSLPDEQLVHNLEHGDIWIAYHPRVSSEVKKRLRSFAGGKVIVTLREANEFDISLVAWGRVDSFNLEKGVLGEERVSDFIKRYIDKGPEKVPAASMVK